MSALELKLIKKRTAYEIHEEAIQISKSLKTHYLKLFEVLCEIEAKKIYFQFEITSLHSYCVDLLGLSRHSAYDFIDVVRTSLEVPELALALRSGNLTISKARKICSVLTSKNSKEWIDLATTCSCRVVEKAVAQANPRAAVVESMKYVSGDVLELKMAVSEDWERLLKKTKDLLSQKERRTISAEEAMFILMTDFCQKNDPVEKAKRSFARKEKQPKDPAAKNSEAADGDSVRTCAPTKADRYRPRTIEHIVNLRDQGQCVYVDRSGQRCESKRWIEKHHIHEFKHGGTHTPGESRDALLGSSQDQTLKIARL